MSDNREMQALLEVAGDICGKRIPAVYRDHGVGLQVEENVVTMLKAALDCLERARDLAIGDAANVASIDQGIDFLLCEIGKHTYEVEAWKEAALLVEAARAPRH